MSNHHPNSSSIILKTFKFNPNLLKQIDLLVHSLENFPLIQKSSHQNQPQSNQKTSNLQNLSSNQIDQLQINEIENLLNQLNQSQNHHDLQDPHHQNIHNIQNLKIQKFIRSRIFNVPLVNPNTSNAFISIKSWIMLEHIYLNQPCPFPTLARGLFTHQSPQSNLQLGLGKYKILTRGYDKFFNINEINSTKWENLEKNTLPPYHLTLKTNGCIIFISAIDSSNLLITSKHATIESSPYDLDQPQTHSLIAQRWLDRHLNSVSLTRPQLAQELWHANATAIAELTDDEFEEHVIQTPSNQIGLNLHGINLNIPQFTTYPPSVVAQCAKRWGFHQTPYITLNSLNQVKDHCSQIQLDGWPNLHTPIE
ncbi:hypothetical protein O181_074144, partial [Austropuccinia psidii MF-1]|nr:hypothetical protein [Austropuccinia psidii MF-1]